MIEIHGHEVTSGQQLPWPAIEVVVDTVIIPRAQWEIARAAMDACLGCSDDELNAVATRARAMPELFPNVRLGWPPLETPDSRRLFGVYSHIVWATIQAAAQDSPEAPSAIIAITDQSATSVARGIAYGLSLQLLRSPLRAPYPNTLLDLRIKPVE